MHPRRYETLILLSPNLATEDLDAFKGKIETILDAGHGQVVRFEDWGRRRLSYPVNKEFYGYYLLYDFQGSPALAEELERNLKIDEQVFKFLTLILEKKFTDEQLAAEKERLLNEASRREAERNQPAKDEDTDRDNDDDDDDDDVDGDDSETFSDSDD